MSQAAQVFDVKSEKAEKVKGFFQSQNMQQCGSNAFEQQYGPNDFEQQYGSNDFEQQYGTNAFEEKYGPNSFEEEYGANGFETQGGPNSLEQQYDGNSFAQQFGPNAFAQQFGPNAFPQQFGPNAFSQQFGPNAFPQQFGPNSGQLTQTNGFLSTQAEQANAQSFVQFTEFQEDLEMCQTKKETTQTFQKNIKACVKMGFYANAKLSHNQKAQVVEAMQTVCTQSAESLSPNKCSQYKKQCQAAARAFKVQGNLAPTWFVACQMCADPQCNQEAPLCEQVAEVMKKCVQQFTAQVVMEVAKTCDQSSDKEGAKVLAQNAGQVYLFLETSNNSAAKQVFLKKTQRAAKELVETCQENFQGNFKKFGLSKSVSEAEVIKACKACAGASPSTLAKVFA